MFLKKTKKTKKAFTLLEVLLVVALLAILAGIVILAINPGKQIADTNNAQRAVDVNTVLNAVYQYSIDNQGSLPNGSAITSCATDCGDTVTQEICVTGTADCTGFVELSDLTNNEDYLVSLPNDPTEASTTGTGYHVCSTAGGRVSVCAPGAENGVTIEVTR